MTGDGSIGDNGGADFGGGSPDSGGLGGGDAIGDAMGAALGGSTEPGGALSDSSGYGGLSLADTSFAGLSHTGYASFSTGANSAAPSMAAVNHGLNIAKGFVGIASGNPMGVLSGFQGVISGVSGLSSGRSNSAPSDGYGNIAGGGGGDYAYFSGVPSFDNRATIYTGQTPRNTAPAIAEPTIEGLKMETKLAADQTPVMQSAPGAQTSGESKPVPMWAIVAALAALGAYVYFESQKKAA